MNVNQTHVNIIQLVWNNINAFTCKCSNGFTGQYCEINIDDCAINACSNRSKCIDGINEYTCVCDQGITGTFCEQEINECLSNPCYGGSTCLDKLNSFSCLCLDGMGWIVLRYRCK